jgi:hypothetical protein
MARMHIQRLGKSKDIALRENGAFGLIALTTTGSFFDTKSSTSYAAIGVLPRCWFSD